MDVGTEMLIFIVVKGRLVGGHAHIEEKPKCGQRFGGVTSYLVLHVLYRFAFLALAISLFIWVTRWDVSFSTHSE